MMRKGRITRKEAFVVADDMSTEQVLLALDSMYDLCETRSQKINEHYFDTFDWRLLKKNYLLKRRGKTFFLTKTDEQRVIQVQGPGRKTFFSWDLEKGEIRNILQSIAAIRALVVIVIIKIVRKSFNLRNKDRKAVLHLHVDDSQVDKNGMQGSLPQVVYLKEVRGYEKAFNRVVRMLETKGLHKLEQDNSLFLFALSSINQKPFDYSSKFTITLQEEATVQESVSAICLRLIAAMEMNIEGVIGDIDSEFLHDFRIAVRRTRSLLSQMKKQLPFETYRYFQEEFKWLGYITGPVRDLDVYLLEKDQYQSMLPVQLHQGLNEFFVDLERRRKNKLLVMRKGLTSNRYEKLMYDWKRFLSGDSEVDNWPTKDKLCKPLAVKMIGKRFRRLIKDGSQIDSKSPDEALHRLRIQGKKLRYMLDIFRSFFDESDISFFLKQLKRLQDNLGDFNDISVQQEMLIVFQNELTGGTKRSIGIAAALGGLISHLADEHVQIRLRFEKTFGRFACEENREKFDTMFL